MYIDKSRSWIPQRGTSQLSFVDDTGNSTSFLAKGVDTTVVNTTDCGDTYNYEYITNVLYLNAAHTDSIHFSLFNTANLEGRASANNAYSFSMFDIFGKAREGVQAKNIFNFTAGNKTYQQGILVFRNEYFAAELDSVFLANNAGIVAFKYYGRHYSLR
ncbi:hypothetical protein [Flavisolibacter nicotianae]|uniref:hypothetical protein n=1 Tax=Flavisolibacter nicotianae TaxID=2364882 RepID=UPI0013C4B43D|nr:hypothetical protein [Flavisolibacter nicotianae]